MSVNDPEIEMKLKEALVPKVEEQKEENKDVMKKIERQIGLSKEDKVLDDAALKLQEDATKPPEDKKGMDLDTLDDQSKAADDEAFLAELNKQYTINIVDGIEAARKRPIYAGGLQQEMVSATDPTSLLLES